MRPILALTVLGATLMVAEVMAGATREQQSFPHDSKEHQTVSCAVCHSVTAESPEVLQYPPHQPCVPCHNFAEKAMDEGGVYCQVCHEAGFLSVAEPRMADFQAPTGRSDFVLPFLHGSHLKGLPEEHASSTGPLSCRDCHDTQNVVLDPVVTSSVLETHVGSELPITDAHAGCFSCHNEVPLVEPAMNRCDGCHATVTRGEINSEGEPLVRPTDSRPIDSRPIDSRPDSRPADFRHSDHLHDIRPKKKQDLIAHGTGDLCRECHAPLLEQVVPNPGPDGGITSLEWAQGTIFEGSICATCHRGDLGLPEALAADVVEALKIE